MDIKRDKYLNDLINRMHNGMIKVVTGIRRCGKSYLLFNIFKNYLLEHGVTASHIITIELDQRKNKKYRDPDTILDYIESLIEDDEQYYIMLDEVQMLQEFEEVLNSLLHIRNADIYVTGSNSKFLSKDVITEFRGRGDEIHIYPLTFKEFMEAYDGDMYRGWAEYVVYGGLPLTVTMKTEEQKISYLTNLFKETYLKDIIERHHIEKTQELEDLNQKQVEVLIEAAKKTPIYLQVMFAVLMGLRRSEIIGVKYSDIDYINRTLHVERQLGKVPMSKKEDYKPKTYTKQEIDVKTESSNRVIPIPDILFEAILEEKQKYEKNRKRRINDKNNPFFDGNYICCSTYGKPRSKDFHWKYFKQLLQENDLPDIRWHDLRATYCTILLKNDFNPKAVSKLMGHAKEIITIDVYGDKQEIIEDCLEALEPFIDQKRI